MLAFRVRCIEKLESGNWRVQALDVVGADHGRPFVIVEKMGRWKTPAVLWMRDPHPGRVCDIRMPYWRAARHRQLVGDEQFEAEKRRKRDLRERRKTGADPQLWDRRFRTARGEHSTGELALAKFGDAKPLTREDVEAAGGSVSMMRVVGQSGPDGASILMGRDARGRLIGRVHEPEADVECDDAASPQEDEA